MTAERSLAVVQPATATALAVDGAEAAKRPLEGLAGWVAPYLFGFVVAVLKSRWMVEALADARRPGSLSRARPSET